MPPARYVIVVGIALALFAAPGPRLAASSATTAPAWFTADGTTSDRSGAWPPLTWSGPAGFATGRSGQAFLFDGGNGLRGTDPLLGDLPTGPFTVRFDVLVNALPADGATAHLIGKVGVAEGWWLTLAPDGIVSAHLAGAGPAVMLTTSVAIGDGDWHTIVLERAGQLCLILDGMRVATSCAPVANAPVNAPDAVLTVAGGGTAGPQPFAGLIDELYLAPGTLADLHAVPVSAPPVPAGASTVLDVVLEHSASSARPGTVRIDPPPGARLVAVAGPTGCRVADGAVVCDDGAGGPLSFAPGQTKLALTIVADAEAGGTVAGRITWTDPTTPDLQPADNIAVPMPLTVVAAPATTTTTTAALPAPTTLAPTPPSSATTTPAAPPATDPTTAAPQPAAPAPFSPPPSPTAAASTSSTSPPSIGAPANTPAAEAPVATSPTPGPSAGAGAGSPAASPTSAAPTGTAPRPAAPAARGNGLTASADGLADGPPGAGLTITGTGYGDCATVYLFFDGILIGRDEPDAAGAVRLRGVSVPGFMRPGRYEITSACDRSGSPIRHRSAFEVNDASWHRTAFVTSTPRPFHVDWRLGAVMTSAFWSSILVVLVGFPSQIFNRTLDEHYDEIRRRLRWKLGGRPVGEVARWIGIVAFFAASALLNSLLDPSFGRDLSSLQTYSSVLTSSVVVLLVFALPTILYMYWRHAETGRLRVRLGTLPLAALFVAISRVFALRPGYLYGLLAGFIFRTQLEPPRRAQLAAAKVPCLLAIGLVAWFAWSPVADLAGAREPFIPVLFLEAVLAAIFVGAIVSSVFGLMPLRLLDGKRIADWSRPVWAAEFGVATFLMIHVLLRPNDGYARRSNAGSVVAVATSFAIFTALSLLFWAAFRDRNPPPSTADAGG